MNRDRAKTEFTGIPYFDNGKIVDAEFGENMTAPFRVNYSFMYWVSPDEVYQGNIMTTYKKLFNAD